MNKTTLLSVLSAVLISLCIAGCSSSSSGSIQSQRQYPTTLVSGRVINPLLDNAPISGASVSVSTAAGGTGTVTTGTNGNFAIEITVEPGTVTTITFTKKGYIIENLPVNIATDGSLSYNELVNGYLPVYAADVSYITNARPVVNNGYGALSPDGKYLYLVDSTTHSITKYNLLTNTSFTLAGTGNSGTADGKGSSAEFNHPTGIAVSSDGDTLYVSDFTEAKIRKITGAGTAASSDQVMVYTIAGNGLSYQDGPGMTASLGNLSGITLASDDDNLYVCSVSHSRVARISGVKNATGKTAVTVYTVVGSGTDGIDDGQGDGNVLSAPFDVTLSRDGDTIYVSANGLGLFPPRIKKITGVKNAQSAAATKIYTIAGSDTGDAAGRGDAAKFNYPYGIAIANDDDTLFVADYNNKRLKKISGIKNAVSPTETYVSNMAVGSLNYPRDTVLSPDNGILYIIRSSEFITAKATEN